jgi:hypothetical protein
MPSLFLSSAKSLRTVSNKVRDRKIDELTEWIRTQKVKLPVRQPKNREIIRTDPQNDQRADALPVIRDGATGLVYRVSHELVIETGGKYLHRYGSMSLPLAVSRDGSLFIWPALRGSEGTQVMRIAIEEAAIHWMRILESGSSHAGMQNVRQSTFPEPIWPRLNWSEIADMFFDTRVIESLDHPVHKELVETSDISQAANIVMQ